jgi:hypothetical protein
LIVLVLALFHGGVFIYRKVLKQDPPPPTASLDQLATLGTQIKTAGEKLEEFAKTLKQQSSDVTPAEPVIVTPAVPANKNG